MTFSVLSVSAIINTDLKGGGPDRTGESFFNITILEDISYL